MTYRYYDVPDLPIRAFIRRGRSICPQGKSDPPPAPDYTAAANATAAGNLQASQQATVANRPNQYTPYGSQTWSQDGNGQWTGNVSLSPVGQQLLDQSNTLSTGLFGAQNQALGNVNNQMAQGGFNQSAVPQAGTALNPGSLPQGGTALNTNSLPSAGQAYNPNQASNNATDLMMARINPQLDRQQAALQTQLANQGITQGSAAYNTAMYQNQQGRNDATNQAALSGIGLGMQQQGQTFGQQTTNQMNAAGLQNQQFGQMNANQQIAAGLQNQQFNQANSANSLAMQNQAFLANQPINQLSALRSGSQVTNPQFNNFATQQTTAGPNLLGAAGSQYQADLGNSNASSAQSSGMMGGLFGIAGGVAGGMFGGPMGAMAGAKIGGGIGSSFSDRRLKRAIKRIGRGARGLPVYSFHYAWGGPTQIGYMADEVEKIAPWAVGSFGGLKTVDYSRV